MAGETENSLQHSNYMIGEVDTAGNLIMKANLPFSSEEHIEKYCVKPNLPGAYNNHENAGETRPKTYYKNHLKQNLTPRYNTH